MDLQNLEVREAGEEFDVGHVLDLVVVEG